MTFFACKKKTVRANTPLPEAIDSLVSDRFKHYQANKEKRDEFWGIQAPVISVQKYLERFIKYLKPEDNILIIMLIYIDRYLKESEKSLCDHNAHRLIAASFLLAMKFHTDEFFNNTVYAKVAGISLRELNLLEEKLLNDIQYTLYVSEEEFGRYSDVCRR